MFKLAAFSSLWLWSSHERRSCGVAQTQSDIDSACKEWEHVMFFDGGSRGNPGSGGCGAVVEKDGKTVWQGWAYLEDEKTTNNVAEYAGLILGIKGLRESGASKALICGDSKLVLNQLTGTWKCRGARLAALRQRAVDSLQGIDYDSLHVSRQFNGEADALANRAMDTKASGSSSSSDTREESPLSSEEEVSLRRERDAVLASLDSMQRHLDDERTRIMEKYSHVS